MNTLLGRIKVIFFFCLTAPEDILGKLLAMNSRAPIMALHYTKKYPCGFLKHNLLAATGVSCGAIAFLFSLLRYMSLGANMYDLGMFDQALWHLTQGNGFYSPLLGKSLLAHHWFPIFFMFTPPYFLGSGGPWCLLIIQAFSVGLSIWALGRLMLLTSNNRHCNAAYLFSLLYFFSPGVQNAVMFDFHPNTLSPLFCLMLTQYAIRKKYIGLCLFATLCLLVKEHMGLVVMGIGIITFLYRKKSRRIGFGLMAVGGIAFFILTKLGQDWGFGKDFLVRYAWLGNNVFSMIKTIFLEPGRVLEHAIDKNNLFSYFGYILLPVAGLALLSPRWIIPAIPVLAVNVLCDYSLGRTFRYHYQIEIMPWIYLAAYHGYLKSVKITDQKSIKKYASTAFLITVAGLTCYTAFMQGRILPIFSQYHRNLISIDSLATSCKLKAWVSREIGESCSVASTGSIVLPAVTHRNPYGMMPYLNENIKWDYYIFDLERLHWAADLKNQVSCLHLSLANNPEYRLVKTIDSRIEIYRRVR